MSDSVLHIEGLSKKYRLGTLGTGSFRQDLHQFINTKFRSKNALLYSGPQTDTPNNHIWALKDINLQLDHGDALGIIGSNGSGKSTLLKIIARIIQPTSGSVKGKGRVSSILEVGTGFHHDLTGRENIYISGYTLGMHKMEIKRKFDEIVSFSGIEKFLDTPVKRYSSGMYVRLAFAVAAHLEPDILIVDEVLAVGDAEFQKKCMGKMHDVSSSNGRTILFVSHNMQAVANLCNKALWLSNGIKMMEGTAKDVVLDYLAGNKQETVAHAYTNPEDAPGNDLIRLKSVELKACNNDPYISVKSPVLINVQFWNYIQHARININVKLHAHTGECIFNLGSQTIEAEKAVINLRVVIPANLLNNNTYHLSLTVVKNHSVPVCEFSNCTSIEVEDDRKDMYYFGTWPGLIRPQIENNLYIQDYLP